tara:strand:- start:6876 stop:7961 length:1086 start_codon:yes stop_codon:yes gene_type:complete
MGGAEKLVIELSKNILRKDNYNVKIIILNNIIEHDISDLKDNIIHIDSAVKLSVFDKNEINVQRLQQFMDDFQPDIIHTHLYIAELVSRFCYYPNAKWFSHIHDNIPQFENLSLKTIFSKRRILNYFEKKILFKRYKINGGTTFIAVSNHSFNYINRIKNDNHLILLLNGIDTNAYSCKERKKPTSEIIQAVNIGSYVDKKNQIFLLQLAERLREKKIDSQIYLVGDGPNREILQNEIVNRKLEGKIILTGKTKNVQKYLNGADFYLHSATYEPFGLVLLEAMASGLPVISIDGKGNTDIIEHNKNGYLIQKDNLELFMDYLISLKQNNSLYNKLSLAGIKTAKQFDINQVNEKLIDIYNS